MNGQKGMTMVELIVAVAVTGTIIVFLGMAIHHIITVTEYGNDKLTAMHELQNAAHWFNLDVQEAVAASVNGGLFLTGSDNSSTTYSLVGTELRRTAGGNQMTVAKNITIANFSINDRVITMSLTSAPVGRDNVSESGTYKVYIRSAEGG